MNMKRFRAMLAFLLCCYGCGASSPTERRETERVRDGGTSEKRAESDRPPPSPFKGGWLSEAEYAFREFRVGQNGESYIVGAQNIGLRSESLNVVTKISKDGLFLWSQKWGVSQKSSGVADVAILGQQGVAVTGNHLRTTTDNCPYPKSTDIVNDPPYRVYLAFLDAKTGKRLWIQDSNECSNRHWALKIFASSGKDRVYISGSFTEKISFGPYSVSGSQGTQGFLAAFDNKGKPLWVKETKYNRAPYVFVTNREQILVLGDYCKEAEEKCSGISLSTWSRNGIETSRILYKNVKLADQGEVDFHNEKGFLYFQAQNKSDNKKLSRTLFKVDSTGKIIWKKTFPYNGMNVYSMGLDKQDNLYMSFYFMNRKKNRSIEFSGKTFLSESGHVMLRVRPDGKLGWSYQTSAKTEFLPLRIRFDVSNALYFFGRAFKGMWLGEHHVKTNGVHIWKIPKMP